MQKLVYCEYRGLGSIKCEILVCCILSSGVGENEASNEVYWSCHVSVAETFK